MDGETRRLPLQGKRGERRDVAAEVFRVPARYELTSTRSKLAPYSAPTNGVAEEEHGGGLGAHEEAEERRAKFSDEAAGIR